MTSNAKGGVDLSMLTPDSGFTKKIEKADNIYGFQILYFIQAGPTKKNIEASPHHYLSLLPFCHEVQYTF